MGSEYEMQKVCVTGVIFRFGGDKRAGSDFGAFQRLGHRALIGQFGQGRSHFVSRTSRRFVPPLIQDLRL